MTEIKRPRGRPRVPEEDQRAKLAARQQRFTARRKAAGKLDTRLFVDKEAIKLGDRIIAADGLAGMAELLEKLIREEWQRRHLVTLDTSVAETDKNQSK